ncbi:MAG: hypothetical protein ABIQ02_03470, partial [Saprospiraceae bacterium]
MKNDPEYIEKSWNSNIVETRHALSQQSKTRWALSQQSKTRHALSQQLFACPGDIEIPYLYPSLSFIPGLPSMKLFLLLFLTNSIRFGLSAQTNLPDLPTLLDQHKNEFGLGQDDISEFAISSAYTTEHLNITHVYLEQRYQDIPVYQGILNLNLMGDRLVSFGNRWIRSINTKAPSQIPDIPAQTAVQQAAENLGHS